MVMPKLIAAVTGGTPGSTGSSSESLVRAHPSPFNSLVRGVDPRENLTWAVFGWNVGTLSYMGGNREYCWAYDNEKVMMDAQLVQRFMEAARFECA